MYATEKLAMDTRVVELNLLRSGLTFVREADIERERKKRDKSWTPDIFYQPVDINHLQEKMCRIVGEINNPLSLDPDNGDFLQNTQTTCSLLLDKPGGGRKNKEKD